MDTLFIVGQAVKVVSRDYGTDFYGCVGTITAIDKSIGDDWRFLVDFGETGAEWMFDSELETLEADNDIVSES